MSSGTSVILLLGVYDTPPMPFQPLWLNCTFGNSRGSMSRSRTLKVKKTKNKVESCHKGKDATVFSHTATLQCRQCPVCAWTPRYLDKLLADTGHKKCGKTPLGPRAPDALSLLRRAETQAAHFVSTTFCNLIGFEYQPKHKLELEIKEIPAQSNSVHRCLTLLTHI